MNDNRLQRWFDACVQPTTALALTMISVLWIALFYAMAAEREHAYQSAARDANNLARVFEEYISQTLKSTDSALLTLRKLYEADPDHFDMVQWVTSTKFKTDLIVQFTITDYTGLVKLSSAGPIIARADVSDRPHFRIHADTTEDQLYISAPVIGATSGKWSIQMTRRLRNPDGSFHGVITASLDPLKLEKFYGSVDLGRAGIVSLLGFDGIVRARGAAGTGSQAEFFGQSFSEAKLFEVYREAPTGYYWNLGRTVDRVSRLIAYRVVSDFPLLAIVGLAESDIYFQPTENMRKYYAIGAILTLIIIVAIGIGARREAKLSSATAALENSNAYLARTNTLLDSVLENMPHGVCMFDSEQRLIVSNQRYGELYRLTPEEIRPGTPARAILEARAARKSSAKDAEYYIRNTFATLARSEPYSTINELQDGRIFAVSHRPMPSGGWVSVHQDVTAQQRNAEQIVHMAHHDALTDLPNRVLFMECMKEAVTRASHHGDTFSIFMLDLNRFKAINDSLGHAVGDALLKEVARRLLAVAGETDKVARLGGDEFALLQVANATYPKDDAVILANRILATVSEPYELNGHQVVIGACLGIAVTPDNGVEADQLLRNADLALYRAKSLGRETYCFFESEMDAQARARHALEVDLRMAISRNEFRLHYQSVVDATTKEICGMEALVRWQHPERGLLYPDSFITLSEETGLIAPLGAWILKQACLDAVSWPTHTKVAVNLSPVQFQTTNLVNIVTTALVESGLPPERLELEITESVLLQDDESNLTALHILRGLGLSIVLDDFGTGYSSLGYLRMFPFNKIKIDRSFVGDLSKNAESAAIVCAITGLARTLNMATTAEGVETEEQFTLLRSAGCTQMQGYLFSRPRPLIDCDLAPAREEADSARVA